MSAPVSDPAASAVTVAYLHSAEGTVAYSWHHSMIEMVGYDLAHEARLGRGGYIAIRCGTGGLVEGRNQAVAEFLASEDADWLLWLDTDMGFPPDVVERLLHAADPAERPVVGALCFARMDSQPDGMGGWTGPVVPTIYDWRSGEGERKGFAVRWQYPVNTVTRCAGTGSACVLVHRSVFTRIAASCGGPVWYDRLVNPTTGQLVGEDLSFCARAGQLDIPVHVHTGVRSTHFKQGWLAEPGYWREVQAPPATGQTAVTVPVMGRPDHAAPFMASLRASTGLARVYAVAHEDEVAAAWQDAGADVVTGPVTTFAQKVNLAYGKTAEPWLFVTGSDVQFHPGWLDHAQAAAQGGRFCVIGTNDLGNPRVMAGEHATHLLIRRSYVDETGASWDGPGVVCHEGYGHMFVDDEIVEAARRRGVFASALGSRVEHLHPAWSKGDMDEVYELGLSRYDADRELFAQRSAAAS